jgi:hypothetical protein
LERSLRCWLGAEATSLRSSLDEASVFAPSAVGMGAEGTDVSAGTRRSRSGLGGNPSLTFGVRISEGVGSSVALVDWAFSNLTDLTLSEDFSAQMVADAEAGWYCFLLLRHQGLG